MATVSIPFPLLMSEWFRLAKNSSGEESLEEKSESVQVLGSG